MLDVMSASMNADAAPFIMLFAVFISNFLLPFYFFTLVDLILFIFPL